MAPRPLRTRDIARTLGVHVNTIRLYEASGYLPTIPRDPNGYRHYSVLHLEQARLVQLTLQWPTLGDRALLIDVVIRAAAGDYARALELAEQYVVRVRGARTSAEAALAVLERWAARHGVDTQREQVTVGATARRLNVSADRLRRWERNGLITVPRAVSNRYRRYGAAEFGRLHVIRTLAEAGFSQMAIRALLQHVDAGNTTNLRAAADLPPDEEAMYAVADRWLSTLAAIEERAQAAIRQLGSLIELAHTP